MVCVDVNNDKEEATVRHSDGDFSPFAIHHSRPFGIVGKVVKKEKRY